MISKHVDIAKALDSKVLAFLNASGAKWGVASQLISEGILPQRFSFDALFEKAFFSTEYDLIVFCSNIPKGFENEIALHELVHWAGGEGRTDRDAVVKMQRAARANDRSLLPPMRDYAREEYTAQYGMFLLACELGLDRDHYENRFKSYVSRFEREIDCDAAKSDAENAVKYLLALANQAQAA